MKRSVSVKVAAVAAILALGGVGLAHDALARGGGGGGGGGGGRMSMGGGGGGHGSGMGGGHFGGMGGGGHFGDGGHFAGGHFHGGRDRDFDDRHGRRFGFAPFFGDYGYYDSDCWRWTQYRRRVWVCD